MKVTTLEIKGKWQNFIGLPLTQKVDLGWQEVEGVTTKGQPLPPASPELSEVEGPHIHTVIQTGICGGPSMHQVYKHW